MRQVKRKIYYFVKPDPKIFLKTADVAQFIHDGL